jgi:hypothetical protein
VIGGARAAAAAELPHLRVSRVPVQQVAVLLLVSLGLLLPDPSLGGLTTNIQKPNNCTAG